MGVFHVSKCFLLSSFCLFCLSFSSLPLLFDILNSKMHPPGGVSGFFLFFGARAGKVVEKRPSRWGRGQFLLKIEGRGGIRGGGEGTQVPRGCLQGGGGGKYWAKYFCIRCNNSHQVGDAKGKQSGRVRPRQGTEICNFGAPSPLEALHWIFCFLSSFYVQFRKTSPLKSGESSEKSSGENRVKSYHVCGCHGFFGPETSMK